MVMVSELRKIRRELMRVLDMLGNIEVSPKSIRLYQMATAELVHAVSLLEIVEKYGEKEESMSESEVEGFSEEEGFY